MYPVTSFGIVHEYVRHRVHKWIFQNEMPAHVYILHARWFMHEIPCTEFHCDFVVTQSVISQAGNGSKSKHTQTIIQQARILNDWS